MPPSTSRPDLIDRLYAGLESRARDALERCVALCAETSVSLSLVGGAVRDLLLERPNIDLDLTVEGEVAPIANALAAATQARVVLHERFGTATVARSSFHLDLARSRSESYERPGALPRVEPATLLEDLARRDFTINAIALRLTEPAGELIDPFAGADDLATGFIRVLHERSFQDDATRMLRAVRYAARLGFVLEEQTDTWLQRDLAYLDAVSGPRLRRELTLIFGEPQGVTAAAFADDLSILTAVHPSLRLSSLVARRWREALAAKHYAPLDELGFTVLARPESTEDVTSLNARLHLTGRVERALSDFVRLRGASDKLAASAASPADVVDLLDGATAAAVWALAIVGRGDVATACEAYLERWRQVRPLLDGNDLQALGVAPGVSVGEVLRALRRARLEAALDTREDEVAFVRARLAGG